MPHRITIDRFEGDRKQIAVLLTEDGQQINVPKKLLPRGSKPGDILTMDLGRDASGTPRVANADATAAVKDEAATEEVAEKTRQLQKDLAGKDPGGDMSL